VGSEEQGTDVGGRIRRIVGEVERGVTSTSTPKTIYASELEWEVIRRYAKAAGSIGAACSKIMAYGFARVYNVAKNKLGFGYDTIELMSEIRAKSSFIRGEYYSLPKFSFNFDDGVQEPVRQSSVRVHEELYGMVANVASDFGVNLWVFVRQCIRSGIVELGLVDEPEIVEAYKRSEERFVRELDRMLWMTAKLISGTEVAKTIREELTQEVAELKEKPTCKFVDKIQG